MTHNNPYESAFDGKTVTPATTTTAMPPATSTVIENARIVTPEKVVTGSIRITGSNIAAIGTDVSATEDDAIDVGGRLVLPGLIDIHGDDVESHVNPRNGVQVDFPLALQSADRANVAAGVTTKFHAISFREHPSENRTPELATELSKAIVDTDNLLADHRLHARCEIPEKSAVNAVEHVLDQGLADLVSVMNHTPGQGQYREYDFEDWYALYDDLPREEARKRYERKTSTSEEILGRHTEQVLDQAGVAGIPTAVHDSECPAELEHLIDHGVDICEYPVTMAAAETSHNLGMATAMGAPNLVRGGSMNGNLGTKEAISEGVIDVLCADYHPPSLLAGPFIDTGESLPKRVARVTKAPAEAVGLDDRGRIEEGARADVVVVDTEPVPTVLRAFVGGQEVYRVKEEQ